MGFFKSLFGGKSEDPVEEKEKQIQKEFEILKYDGIRARRLHRMDYARKCFEEAIKLQDDFEPSRPLINGIKEALKKEIRICDLNCLGLEPENVGLKGSPTYVSKAFRNMSSHNAQKYELSTEESVKLLDEKIKSVEVKNA